MKLQNWYMLPEFSWEFSWYSWHKDKSSNISLVPTGWILKKEKNRSKKRSIHELVSLGAWNRLLEFHSTEGLDISSPAPYGMDKDGRIFMQFLEWVSSDRLLSDNYDSSWHALSKKDIRMDFSRRLWRILRIKDIEWLVHWDFQLRHLIHNVNGRSLWVIDVENSKLDASKVQEESRVIREQIDATFRQSPRLKRYMARSIEEWYYSDIDETPILWDIALQLESELGFHDEQIGRLLRR